jgi:hypothetical protein
VHAAPAVSCAIGVKKYAHEHTGQRRHPTFPAQWLYGLYRALPGRAGLVVTVAREKLASHELDASIGASGPHDFTVRIRAVRQRHIRVHRIPSRACDDRETPLVPGRDEIDILLIWVGSQVDFGKSEVDRSADPAAEARSGSEHHSRKGFRSGELPSASFVAESDKAWSLRERRLACPTAKAKSQRSSPRFRPAQVSQRCCHARIHCRRPEGGCRSAARDSRELCLGPMRSGYLCPL